MVRQVNDLTEGCFVPFRRQQHCGRKSKLSSRGTRSRWAPGQFGNWPECADRLPGVNWTLVGIDPCLPNPANLRFCRHSCGRMSIGLSGSRLGKCNFRSTRTRPLPAIERGRCCCSWPARSTRRRRWPQAQVAAPDPPALTIEPVFWPSQEPHDGVVCPVRKTGRRSRKRNSFRNQRENERHARTAGSPTT